MKRLLQFFGLCAILMLAMAPSVRAQANPCTEIGIEKVTDTIVSVQLQGNACPGGQNNGTFTSMIITLMWPANAQGEPNGSTIFVPCTNVGFFDVLPAQCPINIIFDDTTPADSQPDAGGELIFDEILLFGNTDVAYSASNWDCQVFGMDATDATNPAPAIIQNGVPLELMQITFPMNVNGMQLAPADFVCTPTDDPFIELDPDVTANERAPTNVTAPGNAPFFAGGPLPVELTSINAVANGSNVDLTWVTATETNNAGFDVEHATLEGNWQSLGFVTGKGTTTEVSTYSFQATNLDPGTHRFRLKQIDFDGAYEYTPVVEVQIEMPNAFLMKPVYPNPFNPSTTLQYAVAKAQPVKMSLYDATGRLIRTLFEGQVPANETQTLHIDGSGLPSGLYLIRMVGESFASSQTLTLVK